MNPGRAKFALHLRHVCDVPDRDAPGGVSFREDAKGRKGLGTSPFGPSGLTTVPIPCVSLVSREPALTTR